MVPVILALHSIIILSLIGVVLLQRSDGGAALSGGNFMTGRGTANALTRTTSILAALFFTTSMGLAIIAARGEKERSVIDELTGAVGTSGKAPTSTDDLLKSLGAEEPDAATLDEPAPATPAPSTATGPAPDLSSLGAPAATEPLPATPPATAEPAATEPAPAEETPPPQ
ncbi:MAG: preprotein translocase subunit SecG [Parvularculaceae bacterium]